MQTQQWQQCEQYPYQQIIASDTVPDGAVHRTTAIIGGICLLQQAQIEAGQIALNLCTIFQRIRCIY